MTNSPVDGSNRDDYEFLSMADLVRMIWRHRWKIFVVTFLAAAATAIIVFVRPRGYESTAMLQVVPEYARDGRVDRDLFETAVLSHLEVAQSPVIAFSVLKQLHSDDTLAELMRHVKITRPPKTSLIRIVARAENEGKALETSSLWVKEVLATVDKKNIEKAQIFVRISIKELQDDWIKQTAAAEDVRARAEHMQGERLVTVERSVDNNVLWRDLAAGASHNDVSKMTNLFLKSQEMNAEYLDIKRQLTTAEQSAAAARAAREFYQATLGVLNTYLDAEGQGATATVSNVSDEVVQYVDALSKARDILPMGESIVSLARRGALKKIVMAAFGAFAAACLLAFFVEWFKQARIQD